MSGVRNVEITLGGKNYSIETVLDNGVLNGIIRNIQESFGNYEDEDDQEKSLLLVCLDLSYKLEELKKSLSVGKSIGRNEYPES